MPDSLRFNCYLMGDQSRLIQCGQLLLEKGHQIEGIISKAPPIQSWAKENKLRLITPGGDIVEQLKQQPFDLFFSIDNFNKVPNEILALPRVHAINFHDAPLPRYGGVNATNWAIMNGETQHGITWHIMTDVMDAGDILKQKTFSVSATETAYSLNAKCYEESIKCFSELMDELASGQVKPIRQNLEYRTYFPRWKRPPAACWIDWNRSADEIYALIRGLDFKSFWNPLGLPKLYLGDNTVIITQLNKLASSPSAAPGTITKVSDTTITVATATQEVVLGGFSSFIGEPISPSQLLVKYGLREGSQLSKLKTERADKITRIHRHLCRFEGFWLQRLANLKPIEIPYKKRAASASETIEYQEARFLTSRPIMDYQEISEKPGDILLNVFLLYLSRIGMKEIFDINFRDTALQEDLKGEEVFFASQVPLRIDVDYELSFKEFSKSMQNQIKSARSYGSYARDLVLRVPNLRKTLIPHFSQGLPVAVERIKDLSEFQPTCTGELIFVIPDDGKECLCLYDKAVLSKASIDRLREQFTMLLNDIAMRQNQPIGDLSILPERERRILLSEWHGPEAKFPQQKSLMKLFESQVERIPDAEALFFKDQHITYRQLNQLANKVADKLQSLGVEPDSLVALCVERSIEMVVGIIGILKSGGAYVPLDPAYPKDRLGFILEDTRASVLLTQQHLKADLPKSSAKIITFDPFEMEIPSKDPTTDKNPLIGVTPENLAYVIYTSGSTGKPKGVLVTHGNVMRLMKATEPWYNFVSDDVWTLFHSFAFDFSVWEMWGALLYGGRLVIIPYEVSRSPSDFYKLLMDQQVTVLNQTPSAFYQLIQAEETQPSLDDLALRLVIFGGEALELQNLKPWFKRHGDKKPQLANMYGITETTVHVTYRPITNEDVQGGQGSVIGEPIPDLQLYVLDRNLQPVPIGVAGELFVGGEGLARGYLNRPELTEERFISNPFSNKPGDRLYKTGDVARFLPNRDLEYLGRADQQVQIRGFRVELGEIETVLMDHENVNQAVVIVRGDQADDQRLAAYFVSTSNQSASSVELRKHLQAIIPEYMIPQYFVELESIPLTPNGKVDRRALPEPQLDRQTEDTYVAPRNQVEKIIAGIWQQLLNIKNIGIQDNFFEIGGHSLLLVRMLNKLQKSFKREFSIIEMFRHPTIATLANFVTQKQEAQISFATTFDLVNKQKESLKRQKRLAKIRRNSHG